MTQPSKAKLEIPDALSVLCRPSDASLSDIPQSPHTAGPFYNGVFWIYCTMSDGVIIWSEPWSLIALTDPIDSNHQRLWATLPANLKGNHAFNYYPRGRVQFKNGKAKVYLNPILDVQPTFEAISAQFNLSNAIQVQIIRDGSVHYHCFLDDSSIE